MRIRTLMFGALMALAGLSFAQPMQITWWDFLSGGDGVRMKALIDQFNQTHPDIKINATTLEWGTPFYTKVQTSEAVGEQPDIMTYHLSRYPLAVQQNALTPITDEELAAAGLSKDDYQPGLIDAATFDGKLYGVPFDIHSIILYYNKGILDQAGLLGSDGKPQGLDGLDNFNAALQKIKDAGKQPLCYSTSADPGTEWRVYYTLVKQQGGNVVDGDQVVNDEKNLTALQTMMDWAAKGYEKQDVDYTSNIALFTSGECAMMINGVWEVPTMVDLAAKNQLFDWGAVPVPTLFDQPATWADSHTFAIPNSAKSPVSADKRAAVMQIIAWFNKNSLAWAGGGHIPAYKPVTDSAAYQEMEPNASYAPLKEHAVFDPQTPVAGVASPIFDAVQNYIEPALNGQLDAKAALQMFTDDVQSQMMQ